MSKPSEIKRSVKTRSPRLLKYHGDIKSKKKESIDANLTQRPSISSKLLTTQVNYNKNESENR
ncbi:hypothetical protein [Gillisia sp. JM1]|uniref:hypothetical protein n=1 Tax=Gillisia sp. JM1 TaxID=1283286 RepID=UPI0004228955|nr:hypothetical protein [Gillisia sp. JM1]